MKADFIKAKHQHLAFILHPSKEECCTEEELSKQLHSSVRTSNLETSLRLLAQGANPSYFYKVQMNKARLYTLVTQRCSTVVEFTGKRYNTFARRRTGGSSFAAGAFNCKWR